MKTLQHYQNTSKAENYDKYNSYKRLPRKLKKKLKKDPQYTMHNMLQFITMDYQQNMLPLLCSVRDEYDC